MDFLPFDIEILIDNGFSAAAFIAICFNVILFKPWEKTVVAIFKFPLGILQDHPNKVYYRQRSLTNTEFWFVKNHGLHLHMNYKHCLL